MKIITDQLLIQNIPWLWFYFNKWYIYFDKKHIEIMKFNYHDNI